ncbi:serine/threonine-protein kinase [Streptomyces sp. NPDC002076]
MRGEILDGRYELVERLGRGGMGQVWAARDTRMHREVAVKLVTALPRIGEHETFLRFRREIRSAAQLPGRYTVIAHDCGEAVLDDERVLYMVMERLTGRTLYDEVVQERPSWRRAVAWARQVAAALDAAHRQGIVHRDIKPENVMFDAEGDLKVVDFGIAKFLGDTVLVSGLTGTGVAPSAGPSRW